ncbi:MAG: nucleotide sugar dehydrogenase [Candidatus Micrarchaeota archaeon]|nr:nucleotide sugar dehydrogenase [Candidatus Micrarchaeota archaeon]MDE1847557.1 nucleotide sugar dehydrogenase [Candidatus Micrarchaeota archaeon]MDE1864274.1 nucleotide sugar dehydrogenase [Candidatus Micrarchaeota archaeon]
MKIAVIGIGYVGLPLAALLSEKFDVLGFDIDAKKIAKLNAGEETLKEPGLKEALDNARPTGRLKFTTSQDEITDCNVKIISVGTPYDESKNDVDYTFLDSALEIICKHLRKGDVVALKSTVPVGTTSSRVAKAISSHGFKVPEDVGVVFSPERIVEGQAVRDFKALPKIIGASDDRSFQVFSTVLSVLGGKIIKVSNPETAELIKMTDNYARFAFLGITNELALASEKFGVDVMEMLKAAKEDYPRNSGLLVPGPGVGGSCLNKDPFILKSNLDKMGLSLKMVDAAKQINSYMPTHISEMVKHYRNDAKVIAIAGVAFKGETDDTRFTPSFKIKDELKVGGAAVRLSDPFVNYVPGVIPDIYEAVRGAEVLVIVTDHNEYKSLDLERIKSLMNSKPLIIDTRALIPRDKAKALGFEYHGLGRL